MTIAIEVLGGDILAGTIIEATEALSGALDSTCYDVAGEVVFNAARGNASAKLEPVTVTASSETQTIVPEQGVDGFNSITVNPVPSNYGLITYNGSTITVS